MHISRYQKLFGVGPLSLAINIFLLAIMWMIDSGLGHAAILSQPAPIRAAGWILIGIWICWHIWSLRTIRMWWQGDKLCTTGPYRFVRHPIYAGGLLLAFPGICLMFNSWIVLFTPVLQYIVVSLLVGKEEAMMESVFGDEYRRYAARTGRLFPRLIH